MEKKMLGKKINTARKDCGLTGEKLSEACNINATYLRQIEAGIKMPSLPVFITLCKELRVSPSYLLSDILSNCGITEIDTFSSLYQQATPKQLQLISTMVKSALDIFEDNEQQ